MFLFYTGTKQQVKFLRGRDPEVASHHFQGKRHFGTIFLWMDNKVYSLLQQRRLFFGFYLYCPGLQNVHSRCELESEIVVVDTCGELFAI